MGFVECGILVSQAGTEPVSPALESGFLTTEPPRKSPMEEFLYVNDQLFFRVYLIVHMQQPFFKHL